MTKIGTNKIFKSVSGSKGEEEGIVAGMRNNFVYGLVSLLLILYEKYIYISNIIVQA